MQNLKYGATIPIELRRHTLGLGAPNLEPRSLVFLVMFRNKFLKYAGISLIISNFAKYLR
jgi:hypothetical protein